VLTELGRSQAEVQGCTLSSDVGRELGEELGRGGQEEEEEEEEDENNCDKI